MANLFLSQCAPDFKLVRRPDEPKWLRYIEGTLTHPTMGDVATIICLRIASRKPFKVSGDFDEWMEGCGDAAYECAMAVFNRYGKVQSWLADPAEKTGSGCWGTELNTGNLLFILHLDVKEEFRRQGLGSFLLEKLLDSSYIGVDGHVFSCPVQASTENLNHAAIPEEPKGAVTFFRKVGFRRVGLSKVLAYSPSPSHPSHKLDASADPDPPPYIRPPTPPGPAPPKPTQEELKAKYPIHFAVATNQTPGVSRLLHVAHALNPGSLRTRDLHGHKPIHIAAANENLHAVRTLLELDPSGIAEDLNDKDNGNGKTPLEVLRFSMRPTWRFFGTVIPVGVRTRPLDDALACESLLVRAMASSAKSGCTCGKCTGGWLSPRMRFRLSDQAGSHRDQLGEDLSLFESSSTLSASQDFLGTGFDYVPPALTQKISKSFYLGFLALFDAVYQILENARGKEDNIPLPQHVLTFALASDSARAVQFYLDKGGKVEYVLDATVDMAREQSPLGDGSFDGMFDRETFEELQSDVTMEEEGDWEGPTFGELPVCKNDLEFGIVRELLGIGPARRHDMK